MDMEREMEQHQSNRVGKQTNYIKQIEEDEKMKGQQVALVRQGRGRAGVGGHCRGEFVKGQTEDGTTGAPDEANTDLVIRHLESREGESCADET